MPSWSMSHKASRIVSPRPEFVPEQYQGRWHFRSAMPCTPTPIFPRQVFMKLDGKTVLVTGGAGFIGSHLVDALRHCTVRVLDDLSTGKEANLGDARKNGRLEFVHGDIRDRGLVAKLLRAMSTSCFIWRAAVCDIRSAIRWKATW